MDLKQQIYIDSAAIAFLVFAYSQVKPRKDPLEIELFWTLNGWSASHLVSHMVLGYRHPEEFWKAQTLGALWESYELIWGKTGKQDAWWYSRKSDILVNSVGFLVGKKIREHTEKKMYI